MNDATVLLYLLCFAVVVGMTFAFMYAMMKTTLREVNQPTTRPVHPEMKEVRTGAQLLVFRQPPEEDEDDDGDAIIIRK